MPLSSQEPTGPQSGMGRDIRRAREGAFATSAELREFVNNMRGKSPQEVLGAVANSGLAQGVGLATVGTILVIAVFTAGPYFIYGKPPSPAAKKEAAAAAQPAPNTSAAASDATADKAAAPSKDAANNAQQTLEKMGESETKQADPKVNPLDNLDDLLDTKK